MNENQFKEKKDQILNLCESIDNVLLGCPLSEGMTALLAVLAGIPDRCDNKASAELCRSVIDSMRHTIEKMEEVYLKGAPHPATPSPNPRERNPC